MAQYVCSGAKLKCSMGSRESSLAVMHPVEPVYIRGKPMACMSDHKPIQNIKSFGQCKSLANPVVATATAANNGRLQKMPCVPNTTTPWMGAKMNLYVKGQPALLDNNKLLCMWMGIIEIKDSGQNFVKEGTISQHETGSADANRSAAEVAKEEAEKEVNALPIIGITDSGQNFVKDGTISQYEIASAEANENASEETMEEAEKEIEVLTIKDFVEILKKIEDKQGYEAAKHYAINDIDYWKVNELAKKYVNETDDEKKEEEKDNDPNQMPSRFMLLYGADDKELDKLGNINEHPDNFEGHPEHKISVGKLREGLILLGHDIAETGPFDDYVYHTFLQYLQPYIGVNLDNVYEDDDEHEKPLEELANRYGVFSWKYFHDNCNGEIDHECVVKELSAEYGDELLAEKGGDPETYKPGISYYYVWVPFSLALNRNEGKTGTEGEGEKSEYKIFNGKNYILVAEGEVVDDTIEGLFPNVAAPLIFVDGKHIFFNSEQPERTNKPQIVKTYWSYGEEQQRLHTEISRHYADLNLHVKTRNYNDGDIVSFTLKAGGNGASLGDTETIDLNGAVYDNKIIFKNVFKNYTSI